MNRNRDLVNYQTNVRFLLEASEKGNWNTPTYNAGVAALLEGLPISLAIEAALAEITTSTAVHH